MKFCAWLWLLLVALNSQLLAQTLPSRNLSIQQGLPEYYVSGIVQDKAGFIWVATRDGLARYDGRQFKVFRHQPTGPPSLAGNVISSMQPVSDSSLLIHLENNNFQLFNPITEQFTDVLTNDQLQRKQVKLAKASITPDEKIIWGRFLTQLTRYDRQTGQFITYPFTDFHDNNAYPGQSFLLANQQQLFMPLPGRLLQFDAQARRFQAWAHELVAVPGKIDNYYGTPQLERADGTILIGAARHLLCFNPKTHRFRSIPIPSVLDTQVGLLYQAPDGQVYFTYGMSVYRLSLDDQLIRIWTAPRIDYQNYFHALLLDHSGVLWIGTNGDGIYQLDQWALPIKTYPYRTYFFSDVLKTEVGLVVPPWTNSGRYIYHLKIDGTAPSMTVGRNDGSYELFRGDPKRHQFRTLLRFPRTQLKAGIFYGNALRQMPNALLWMFDPHFGLLQADSAGKLLATFPCPIPINRVSSIQPLGQTVWIGSEESGLYAYDLKSHQIVRHVRFQQGQLNTLLSDYVVCLVADPTDQAILWVGTQEGLCRLDTRTMRWQNYTEEQGLPSATIHTLLTDRQGNLWFSTGRGITRMNPRTRKTRHFSTADGLQDIEYRANHAVQLPDGRMAFGGATGVTVFDPLRLTESVQPIPTALMGFRLANVPLEPGQSGSPLSRPINDTELIRLQPNQNFFSIEYAGLQYNKPASLRYRYQLEGVDVHWVDAGNQTLANYTQLAPGEYVFRVNTANAEGRWSPLIKTIRIVIDPPWWQTGWAYGFYILLIGGLVGAYLQYRNNRAQLRQQLLLQEQEARLTKQNADWQTRFFTNITHEFRTPLTLILGPVERLLEPTAKFSRVSLAEQLGVVYRNTQRLLRLINQLLDIAKLEAGQLAVHESQGNLPAFFAGLVDLFRARAEKKGIRLTYESSGLMADYRFDAHKLETIGYNLLANALKFTPAGGQIKVALSEASLPDGASGLDLRVSDTGPGIAPEQLPHIFDRFYQGQTTDVSSGQGTGIGLYLVAEFSRLLGGSVRVESQVGQGTTFTVTLPLGEADSVAPRVEAIPSQTPWQSELASDLLIAPETAPLVLVVEDNDELREFMASELARHYRVMTAANGQEGWQVCLAELPDLVISDVMMPVQAGPLVDGFTLVERIKTTPLTAHIAVILLTAKTMTESRIQGLSAGANDYLTKPFNVRELQLRISNLLRHQHQLRQHWQQQMSQLGDGQLPAPVTALPVDDPFLIKLYQVLDTQLTNSAYSVDQLADELAVSLRTLHRKLSTLTGSNATDLMRAYRLRKAAGLLQAGASVSEAAEKTGFESLPYFSRSFKAQFAVSPSAYGNTQLRP